MCPFCLTSLAITVATTTGGGAAASALALRLKRSLRRERRPETLSPDARYRKSHLLGKS
jgi:hypothetical protein